MAAVKYLEAKKARDAKLKAGLCAYGACKSKRYKDGFNCKAHKEKIDKYRAKYAKAKAGKGRKVKAVKAKAKASHKAAPKKTHKAPRPPKLATAADLGKMTNASQAPTQASATA